VRPYDSLKARKRGGQRAGLEKYIASAVDGTNTIQQISSVSLAFDSNLVLADTVLQPDPDDPTVTDDISYSDGTLETVSSPKWTTFSRADNNFNFMYEVAADDATSLTVTSNEISVPTTSGSDKFRSATLTTQPTLGSAYILKYIVEMDSNTTDVGDFYASIRMLDDPTNPGDSNRFSGYTFALIRNAGAGTVNIDASLRLTTPGVGTTTEVTNSAFTTTSDATFTATVELIVNGDTLNVKVNGISAITNYTMASHSSQTNFGFTIQQLIGTGPPAEPRVTSITYSTASLPASRRTTKLVVASGGSIFAGNKTDGLTIAGSGSDVFGSTNEIWLQDAFQKMYITDSALYRQYNPETNVVSTWVPSQGALPVGGNGTAFDITAVNTATPSFTVAEDLSSLMAGDSIEVLNSTANDGTYTVASTSGTGPTVITTNQTMQDATVDGTLAVGTVTCRFMALYRGRIVLSGLETDPHNWWMSAVEDPDNFDYFPATETDTQAVAGNTNQAGKLEDIVTALMPYLDDVMYFGGDHTLWRLSGDPAAETGRFDNVSRQIGVVGPEAWTFDATGNLFFLGQNGLYKVANLGTTLEPVGVGKLDDTFANLDFSANRVRLLYDREWRGVHIFITPTSEPSTAVDNYFWDERSDSYWRDVYPTAHGATAVHLFDADQFDDRAVLVGGWDSVIRTFNRTATDDDGTAITSFVLFTPIIAGDTGRISATDITVNLAEGSSSNAILQVFASGTAEDAAAQTTIKAAKVLSEGRNTPMNQRVADNVIQLKVIDSTVASTWSLESGSVGIKLAGNVRKEETS
jgi:hypothetical protein